LDFPGTARQASKDNRLMRKFAFQTAAVLALIASAELQAAQTQQAQTCLTRPEVRGMITYFMPSVLQSAIDSCAGQLKPESYLLGRAPTMVEGLEAGRSDAWPMAKQAILKIGNDRAKGSADMLANLPEEAIGPLITAMVVQEVSADIKPKNCGDIDRVLTTLEPLPASNMVDLVTEVLMLGGRGGRKLQVCAET
jgi:hypothetical protein